MISDKDYWHFYRDRIAWAKHYGVLDTPEWLLGYDNQSYGIKKRLLLAPVGHGKSWWAAKVEALHSICYNWDKRILIVSKTLAQAKNDSQMIRTEIERNDGLRNDYGLEPTDRWGDIEFTVKRESNLKEPTVTAAGLYGQIEGLRPDKIICDDAIDWEATFSEVEREKVRHWFDGTLQARLEPNGEMFVIGTRWHPEDIYAHIAKKPGWKVTTYSAILESGAALWPERWSLQRLAEIRADEGEVWFQFKHMNNPVAMEGAAFKPDWIQYVDSYPDDMTIIVGVDPAATKKELAKSDPDSTAIVVAGEKQGKIYLLDIRVVYIDSNYADTIAQSVTDWKAKEAAVESNMFQKLIVRDMQSRYPSIPVWAVEHYATDKVTRILDLQPRFQSKQIFVWRGCKNLDKFMSEYLGFPTAKHDDIMDALEIAVKRVTNKTEISMVSLDCECVKDGIPDKRCRLCGGSGNYYPDF